METEPKLTEDQKKQLKFAYFKFMVKSLFNGVQHAVMLLVMNILIQLSLEPIFDNDQFCFVILSVASFIIVFLRIKACQKESMQDYQKETGEILKR
jgi:hypothetical protein